MSHLFFSRSPLTSFNLLLYTKPPFLRLTLNSSALTPQIVHWTLPPTTSYKNPPTNAPLIVAPQAPYIDHACRTVKTSAPCPTAAVATLGPKSLVGLKQAPVLYPKAIVKTVTTRPTIKACIPAPGGAFESFPRARIALVKIPVATNSLAKPAPTPAKDAGCVKNDFPLPPKNNPRAWALPTCVEGNYCISIDTARDQASKEATKNLCEDVNESFAEGETTVQTEHERYGRVEVASKDTTRDIDTDCDAQAPCPICELVIACCVGGSLYCEIGAETDEDGYHCLGALSL